MQEERDIGEGAEDKKAEDWKQKSKQAENDQQQQHPRERCPRCESFNTKFCYYNNYSLSQPRHYCKACKRYWTQGGTLRNVPVGGSCRKGKRAKTSSSAGENSRSDQQPPQPEHELQQNLTNPPAIITSDPVFASSPALMTTEPGNLISQYGASIHSTAPYFSGGGCNLSSLAAIQSLNNQPHSFSQALTYTRGGNLEGFSSLDLVHGRFTVPSFGSQQQQRQMQQRRQFYPMGNIDSNMEPLYFTGETWSHSSRQSFLNNTNAAMAADTTLWSNSTAAAAAAAATVNANGNNINDASTSNPSQWPNLPGFGPPQWPSSANSWKLPQSP